MKKYKIILLLTLCFSSISTFSQKLSIESEDYNNNTIEMADMMRADGKIYVLVAIILVIFIGFIFYLIRTEQKLKKIEKEIKIQE